MKIGFTGTQGGMSQHQKEQFVLKMLAMGPTEFHHGDCVGADFEAHELVREFLPIVRIVGHIPEYNGKRAFAKCDELREPLPYLVRNHNIVDAVDFMFAAPKANAEEMRSGTWATVRYARKTGKNLVVLER
jgi:hypothetical protein